MESALHDEVRRTGAVRDEPSGHAAAADMEEHWQTYRGFVRGLKLFVLLAATILLSLYFGLAR